nr:structural glycoprotein E2 [Pestivirus giraffe-1 H138]
AITCEPEYQYALARSKRIGPLGAEDLVTTWHDYKFDLKIQDPLVMVYCKNDQFFVGKRCKAGEARYLAKIHWRALPTSVVFEKVLEENPPEELPLEDNFEFGLCPCDSRPVVKGNFNTTLINHSAFQLVCPIGWVGTIECTLVNTDTLATTVVKRYTRTTPFPMRAGCVVYKLIGEDLHHCTLGGNWTCVPEDDGTYTGGELEKCKWCGFKFRIPDGLPTYPIGRCMKRGKAGYRFVSEEPCNREGVEISTKGKLKCIIEKTQVKVYAADNTLGPMPCKPMEIISSEGPVSKTACTFNYTETLENKYFEPRDEYFQQYMLKGKYQYWFDLKATDNRKDYFAEFLVIAVVALLGGRYVLWLLVTYFVITEQEASG